MDIIRLAFRLIDRLAFPLPSWLLTVETIDMKAFPPRLSWAWSAMTQVSTARCWEPCPESGRLLTRLPGLGDRDIPIPMLHSLLLVTGTESHPGMRKVLENVGVLG